MHFLLPEGTCRALGGSGEEVEISDTHITDSQMSSAFASHRSSQNQLRKLADVIQFSSRVDGWIQPEPRALKTSVYLLGHESHNA